MTDHTFIDMASLFTVNQPVAPAQDQTHVLNGTVHDDVQLMEINGERFGSPSQFQARPVDSDYNKWSREVSLETTNEFSVRVAVVDDEDVNYLSPSSVYHYTDTNVQLGIVEALPGTGETDLADSALIGGQITAAQHACIINSLSITDVSGEYSSWGDWFTEDYGNTAQLAIKGWKTGVGPFGYINAESVPSPHPSANTFLNHGLVVSAGASGDYIQEVYNQGYVTGDRLWTYLFRNTFTLGEDFIQANDLALSISYEGAVEVFLNGTSVYRDGMKCDDDTFPWGYAEYATYHLTKSVTVDLSAHTSLLQQGVNTIGIALKASKKDETNLFLSTRLYGEMRRYMWSPEKQVSVDIATGTQVEVKNFNNLDEFGLLFDLPRLPAEDNVDYKNRLLAHVDPDFPTNSTHIGLLNGISHQFGLPIDADAISIESKMSTEQPNVPLLTGMEIYCVDGYLYFTANEFIISGEQLTIDTNYPEGTTTKRIARLIAVSEEDENIIPDHMYDVPENGEKIEIDPSLTDRDLYVTYQYAERIILSGNSIKDVVVFLEGITSGTQTALSVNVTDEYHPEVYRSTGSVSNELYITDGMITENFNLPEPLFLTLVDSGYERKVTSISGNRINLEAPTLGVHTDVGFKLNVSPSSYFIPAVRFIEEDGVLEIPLYHVRLERVDKNLLEKYANVYEDSVNDASELVRMVRDLMHITWDEQVVDHDLWSAVENRLMSNSEIPALHDMPKQAFQVDGSNEYFFTPEQARHLGHESNDYVLEERFFSSNDFQSGVGSVDEGGLIASSEDLKLDSLVEDNGAWRPRVHTGFFYVGDRTYYLYDTKITRWLNDITWVKVPLPQVLVNDGRTLTVPALDAAITYLPNGYVLTSDYYKIKNDEVWINLSFLNPETSPGYSGDPFSATIRLSFQYEDVVGQDITLQWTPNTVIAISSLERVYLLDPEPTAGAPVVLTDVLADPLLPSASRHPQFAVEDGELTFLDSKIDHQAVLVEWESGSGDYHISTDVDYNPANNPEASGFLSIENLQKAPIGEKFYGSGGIL